MPVFYVYILKCINPHSKKISLYTGSTQDLMKRFEQHRTSTGAQYTKGKDLELAYFETHLTRSAAMKREYEIKTFNSEKKWKLINKFQEKVVSKKNEQN
ncbi:MAG: GIY-YIG nuclease family protein [Promethearchaeota archaeon]